MNRRTKRRRKSWDRAGQPGEVFLFGVFWGILLGMTLLGILGGM